MTFPVLAVNSEYTTKQSKYVLLDFSTLDSYLIIMPFYIY